jgi:hypothetical protein
VHITGLTYIHRPYIERANQTSSTHSRLTKSAILFIDPARPLPHTPKGTVSRSSALKSYAQEISEMYIALEKSSGDVERFESPESWTNPAIVEAWVGKCVADIIGREVDAVADLFHQGMDR